MLERDAPLGRLNRRAYPPPPDDIRSPDGRTYLRWTLHRDSSQCGTWNAEPYILSWTLAPEPRPAQGP